MPLSLTKKYYIAETPEEIALCNAVKNNDIEEAERYILKFQQDKQLQNFQANLCGPLEFHPLGFEIAGNPIILTAAINKNNKMVNMLLRYGFKPNIENHDGCRPIFVAFKNKDFKTVKILINYLSKEELHIKDDFGRDALYFSVLNERLELINILILIYGVKINYQSVLEAAIHANNFELFQKFFFNKTLDEKIENSFLLSLSIFLKNNIAIVEILLNDEETEINIKPETTRAIISYPLDTPLIEAVKIGNKEIIDQLLKKGAKINLGHNYQPFTIAVKNGDLEIAYFLKEHGADITFKEANGLDASNLYVNYLKNLYKKLRESKEKIKNITGICLGYKHETLDIKNLEIWHNILSSHEIGSSKDKTYTKREIEELSFYEQNLFPNLIVDIDMIGC